MIWKRNFPFWSENETLGLGNSVLLSVRVFVFFFFLAPGRLQHMPTNDKLHLAQEIK